ncbi:MAG TPA: zf-HC2 domain-containing protein [Acidobacteriota bacterium]|nr:zf-HC2 domain-containing protein [Acidobacteriota bacterium]
MTCCEVRSLLEGHVDDELSAGVGRAVEEHLALCSDCRTDHESLANLKKLLKSQPRPDPGREYWREVASLILARTVEAEPPARQETDRELTYITRRRSFFRSLVAAAISVLILVSALYVGANQPPGTVKISTSDQPVLLTSSLAGMVYSVDTGIINREERLRLARGILLLGPPGIPGRSSGLTDLLAIW